MTLALVGEVLNLQQMVSVFDMQIANSFDTILLFPFS